MKWVQITDEIWANLDSIRMVEFEDENVAHIYWKDGGMGAVSSRLYQRLLREALERSRPRRCDFRDVLLEDGAFRLCALEHGHRGGHQW